MRGVLSRSGPGRRALYLCCLLMLAAGGRADEGSTACASGTLVGEVISVQGAVDVLDARGELLRRLLPGGEIGPSDRRLCRGETLRTGPLGRATLLVREPPSVIRVHPDTLLATDETGSVRVPPPESTDDADEPSGLLDRCRRAVDRVWLDLRRGALRLFTTEPTRLNVDTPYLNASVEGTEFSLRVDEVRTTLDVVDGEVLACNTSGGLLVPSGSSATAEAGQAPRIRVDPQDAVQWTLHYPVLELGTEGSRRTREALELIGAGRVTEALALLDDGENDAVALALRSIVSVVADERERARVLARRAIRLDPEAALAWTALSYVQQASFALAEALGSAATAADLASRDVARGTVGAAPRDAAVVAAAAATARLAELELIAGDPRSARRAAERAVELAPELSRTHTVLGFLHLDERDGAAASASFRRARERDESDPLPRLGLGLLDIGEGRIGAALLHLEAAVALDPESSLARAYLGRAYALDGRHAQALDQLRLAEAIDASDPLPHLHRAFVLQKINDAHGALIDLQTALDKNDNRAVFRTRSLLDADLAATLAARGRIYEEVGFTGLTLLEGTEALHRNPRDHAAHRLMADAYRLRPRHEIARASEQLQAQMRQPLIANPAPRRLGLSRLGDFPDAGPATPAPNEYSRLFTRRGFTSSVALGTGSRATHVAELQTNWLLTNTLVSADAYRFRTDGLGPNRDGERRTASLFLQRRLARGLSGQIELADVRNEGGADRWPLFERELYNENDRFDDRRRRTRLGLTWRDPEHGELYLSHDRGVLVRHLEKKVDSGFRRLETDSHHSELQHATGAGSTERVLGLSYSDQQTKSRCDDVVDTSRVEHAVAYGYLYPTWHLRDGTRLDYTIGAGLDDLDLDGAHRRLLSPKLGLTVERGRYRLRGAVARTVRRTLATDRTLEPTQVAGFSQLYDDPAGTVSTLSGLGAGIRLGPAERSPDRDLHLDAELVHRHLDTPTRPADECPPGSPDDSASLEERRYALGLYASTPSLSIAFRLEREEYASPDERRSANYFVDSITDRLVLRLNAGIGRRLRLTFTPQYIRQSGTFYNPFRGKALPGSDRFWSVDAGLDLRLDGLMGSRSGGTLRFEIANLFDRDFRFQETDLDVPSVAYERTVSLRLHLHLH